MSTITLELADNDVIFIDDISPNIKIRRDLVPFDDVKLDDVVDIYYDEDSDTDIKHRYIVTNVDDEFIKLEWQRQFNESMLVEGPVKNLFKKTTEKDQIRKAIQKDNKKLDKQNEKIRDKSIKLLNEIKKYKENGSSIYRILMALMVILLIKQQLKRFIVAKALHQLYLMQLLLLSMDLLFVEEWKTLTVKVLNLHLKT